jgi:hypothetical protein
MTLHEHIELNLPSGCTLTTFLLLSAAARLFPGEGEGKSVSPQTVYRWTTVGIPLPGGGRVRLRAWRIGRKLVTTADAIAEFIDAQQPTAPENDQLGPRSPAQRALASDAAARVLEKAGVK